MLGYISQCQLATAVYVNLSAKPLKFIVPTLLITLATCTVVDQKLKGLDAVWFKWLYIDTIYCLLITTVCIFPMIVEHTMNVRISLK
jgi:hypothetical protein